MASKDSLKNREPPEIIVDQKNNRKFLRGKFLGKGGFAKCYELIDEQTKEKFAGKVVPKAALVKPSQKEKMQQEITIHRTLKHENVVGFHGYFEDRDFIYIILELCNRRSLLELHKRRKYITEAETRYFMRQIVNGCQYLHSNKIMHRDLKLANLFLSDELVIKIGDFGLASRIAHEGEKKKTLCGTPNYIAPEVLTKGGHSFEVDSWSLGCILYTLLVGSPPFETHKLEETYTRIKLNEYRIPFRVSAPAAKLIRALLHADPTKRPSMFTIFDDEFFKGFTPTCLPVSALTTCPRFDSALMDRSGRRPLFEVNALDDAPITSGGGTVFPKKSDDIATDDQPDDCWLGLLKKEVQTLLDSAKTMKNTSLKCMDDSEDPASCPIYWISKWVDYSDKYGLGYQLCDNSSGVVFNDLTRLILAADNKTLQFIDADAAEHFYTVYEHPPDLMKKITLLNHFKDYMKENLLKAGCQVERRESDEMVRLPYLRTWMRTQSAIIMHLSNGTLQINFFEDHVKIILCPLMLAVTFIDAHRDFKTYPFKHLASGGISANLAGRMRYAIAQMDNILEATSRGATSTAPSSAVQKAENAGTAAAVKGLAAVQKPTC